MSFSFDLPDLAVETNYIDNINKQIIYQLGIFIKLPKDFSKLVDDKTIKLHKFQDLTSESGHSWLNTFLGAPFYGPLGHFDRELIYNDVEESWILVGTTLKNNYQINRGIVEGKFIYDLNTPYLGDDYILPWKNIIPGFIKSKELGWIGWSYVTTDAEKKPKQQTKFLITWNHHRLDSCVQKLEEKVKKFFTMRGAGLRWFWGRSSVDDDWEQFLREYNVYVMDRIKKK